MPIFRRKLQPSAWSRPLALDPRLGVDSLSFPTFGWRQVVDEPTERWWMSDDGTNLSVHFFQQRPRFRSLDPSDLSPSFGSRMLYDDSQPFVIECAVDRDHAVPLIMVVTRMRVVERERFAFQGSLIAPLARCLWLVKVVRVEGNETGVREALALDAYMREHPEWNVSEWAASRAPAEDFDPYVREWDNRVPDALDPLSPVRRYIDEIRGAIEFGPEVLEEPAFVTGT
jgi:hypothetical protein